MQFYPLGIQTFEKIIDSDLLYIDKTETIYQLVRRPGYYFYARPRRFGKSLMLSTIKALYQGKKELFKGLWIEDKWNWSTVHPVIHLGLSSLGYHNLGLKNVLLKELKVQAERIGIETKESDYVRLFKELIYKLAQASGKVILLIDEYDKPIIDYLGTNIQQAEANRKTLKTFYSVIKDSDPYIEFMMITGVSKFSKVSIFSDLNNLFDITFHPRFFGLVGITPEQLRHYFSEEITELAATRQQTDEELLEDIRLWYNGYSWDGNQVMYNPVSILSFFSFGQFRNFWFETGTPTFLLELMQQQQKVKLDNLIVGETTFSTYDIHKLQLLPLLFQTGYLTIKEHLSNGLYRLDYPNLEVRDSMLQNIIGWLRHDDNGYSKPMVIHLSEALEEKKMDRVIDLIKSIFKNIPNQIFKAKGEFYYHSLVYLVFFYLGQYIESEINTNNGRLDAVVKTQRYIYILEFKLDESAKAALQQIKTKGYADKYTADMREKILVGINFSSKEKNLDGWKMEIIS